KASTPNKEYLEPHTSRYMPNQKLNLEIPKLPWLDEKTEIFRAGEIRPGLAWLPQSPGQWYQYAEGYRDAAESLYTKWREGPIQPDYLAYPMVYLYRHYEIGR